MSVTGVSSVQGQDPFVTRPASGTAGDDTFRIEVSRLASLADKVGKPQPLPPELRIERMLHEHYKHMFTKPVGDPTDHANYKVYAEVKVGGKTIAKLTNAGWCETPNGSPYGRLLGGPDENGMSGPELAQLRAEKIAKASGGTIVMADTALTQRDWLAAPPQQFFTDYDAMYAYIEERHGAAFAERIKYPPAALTAQEMGNS